MNRRSKIRNPKSKIICIRRNLLRWYDQSRRDLPWRRTRDPYAIWIAETMLQQTQVKTVLPYYHRFLSFFPTIEALDRASKDKVLALWSGLGYYRRAENLKKAARRIVREHGGRMPRQWDALRDLPGVGPYTAGAILSIAFDEPYPALDGNARRVLTRIFNVQREKELRGISESLVSRTRPGDFNQALMDLGAEICSVRDPSCPRCPVGRFCSARRSGNSHPKERPLAKRQTQEIEWPLALIVKNGRILLRHRPEGALLGGLCEVPGGERKERESSEAALLRHLNGLGKQLRLQGPKGEIRHSITHRRIRAPLFAGSPMKKLRLPDGGWRWVPLSTVQGYPVSSLTMKAVKFLHLAP